MRRMLSGTSANFRFAICGFLLFAIPIGWVLRAHIHGQRPFTVPISATAHIPTR